MRISVETSVVRSIYDQGGDAGGIVSHLNHFFDLARGCVDDHARADAVSAARPGARRDTVENYVKRLEALEEVANSFPGIEKSYAIQAGREVRILVKPEAVDDLAASTLARDVVNKIQETLAYPGQIKVTVIRETRSVEYAR